MNVARWPKTTELDVAVMVVAAWLTSSVVLPMLAKKLLSLA